MFTITGPGSPSVLTNMPIAIEQHVEWIRDCIDFMNKKELIPQLKLILSQQKNGEMKSTMLQIKLYYLP